MSQPIIVFIFGATLLSPIGAWADDKASDVQDIMKSIEERNQELKSLLVRYRIRSQVLGEPTAVKRYLGVVAEVDEVKTYAFKSLKRYYRLERRSNTYVDIAPDVNVSNDKVVIAGNDQGAVVTKDMETAFDGQLLRRRIRDEERAFIFSDADTKVVRSDAQFFSNEYLWCAFHALPDIFVSSDTRSDHRLPDAIQVVDTRLRDEPETIDGHSCLVIELATKPKQVLWCDPKLSYAVRRWDRYEVGTDHRTWRYDLSEFTEVAPRFWLPRKCIRLRWATTAAPATYLQDPMVRYEIDVTEIQANTVSDELFALSFPAGTEVVDFAHTAKTRDGVEQPLVYPMPAEASDLDKVIAQTREAVESHTASPGFKESESRRFVWIVIFGNVVLLAGFAIFWWSRRSRK